MVSEALRYHVTADAHLTSAERLPEVVRESPSEVIASEDLDEVALITAAQRDPKAFAPLYERHVDAIYRFAYRRVGSHADAEDITAQTFQQAVAALPRYEWRGAPFAAWLFRIARNVIISRSRQLGREVVVEDLQSHIEHQTSAVDDPATLTERNAASAELLAAMSRLPMDQRRALILKFSHGLTNEEIGRRLGRTEGATKQLTHRALKTLRQLLEKQA